MTHGGRQDEDACGSHMRAFPPHTPRHYQLAAGQSVIIKHAFPKSGNAATRALASRQLRTPAARLLCYIWSVTQNPASRSGSLHALLLYYNFVKMPRHSLELVVSYVCVPCMEVYCCTPSHYPVVFCCDPCIPYRIRHILCLRPPLLSRGASFLPFRLLLC